MNPELEACPATAGLKEIVSVVNGWTVTPTLYTTLETHKNESGVGGLSGNAWKYYSIEVVLFFVWQNANTASR